MLQLGLQIGMLFLKLSHRSYLQRIESISNIPSASMNVSRPVSQVNHMSPAPVQYSHMSRNVQMRQMFPGMSPQNPHSPGVINSGTGPIRHPQSSPLTPGGRVRVTRTVTPRTVILQRPSSNQVKMSWSQFSLELLLTVF